MADNDTQLTLITLTADLKEPFVAMLREFEAAGEFGYQYALSRAKRDFASFAWLLNKGTTDRRLRRGRVRQTHFWLVRDGDFFLGGSRLRHSLNKALEQEGGHIGYDIRPSERGKGYGTELLRLTLERARALSLSRVLVTCDEDNRASARIIEKNGGILEDKRPSPYTGKMVSRYWIALQTT
jgi:predicted acetyltransferase